MDFYINWQNGKSLTKKELKRDLHVCGRLWWAMRERKDPVNGSGMRGETELKRETCMNG